MQTFEPLAAAHEVTAYGARHHRFDTGIIRLHVRQLRGWDDFFAGVPGIRSLGVYALLARLGVKGRLFGLERELAQYDVAHVAELSNGYTYQALQARRWNPDLQVVVTVWENIPLKEERFAGVSVGNTRWRRRVVDEADAFVALTERAKTALQIEGVPDERIHILPVGVEVSRFAPRASDPNLRRELGVAPDDFLVLFIGRLTWAKGVHDVLFAAKLLAGAVERRVRFVFVGGGPELRLLQRYVERLGLSDAVRFQPSWPYDDIHRLYNASDAFILPSLPEPRWQEQFGMVLVEAMASGLPVVTTAAGSVIEVVGDAAMVVPPGDPLGLARALRDLIEDPSKGRRLAQLARQRAVEHFDAQAVARMYERLYSELLASRGGTRRRC